MAEIESKHWDKRTMERYLAKGIIKESDVSAHVKALPDDEANAEWVEMELHDAELPDVPEDTH